MENSIQRGFTILLENLGSEMRVTKETKENGKTIINSRKNKRYSKKGNVITLYSWGRSQHNTYIYSRPSVSMVSGPPWIPKSEGAPSPFI